MPEPIHSTHNGHALSRPSLGRHRGSNVDGVLRLLLSRRWIARHAMLLGAVAVLVLLGRWQWSRAMSDAGALYNLLYAVQWWVFAALAVYAWSRTLRDELHPPAAGSPRSARATIERVAAVRTAVPPPPADDDDEELAAYNRHLRRLHMQSDR